MAQVKGTNVASPVVPFDTTDVHPSHEARYGRGGYRTVATTAERDAIPAPRREAGMLVYVTADETIYTLAADLTTWNALELGGGASAWGDITGKPTEFPPEAHSHALADITDAGTAAASDASDFAAAAHQHAWSDITSGVPSSFAPSAHAASHEPGGADELYDQSLNTTDSVTFGAVTVNSQTAVSTFGPLEAYSASVAGYCSAWRFRPYPTQEAYFQIEFGDSTIQTTAWTGSVDAANVTGLAAAVAAASPVTSVNGQTGAVTVSAAVDVRSDTVGSTSYIGRAAPGSATSASVWNIRRTILTSAGAVSSTATATNVKWDDRLTATYS